MRTVYAMKTWPIGEVRRIERAYSPKYGYFGFYILNSFIRHVPANLEAQWHIFTETARYRTDFALIDDKIAIELDGHEFHSSREQRTHDAQRDRALQLAGWKIIRFTGSEIHKDADACINELIKLIPAKRRSLFDF